MTKILNKGQKALLAAQSKAGGRVGGRKKGTPNKVTSVLKELIPEAAAAVGGDGKGRDGLMGWLMSVASSNPTAYLRLLEKLVPHQVGMADGPVENSHPSTTPERNSKPFDLADVPDLTLASVYMTNHSSRDDDN